MIVASKLPNGVDIGGFVLKRAILGVDDHLKPNAPGRERIAGYEITRGVPDEIWDRWIRDNANSPIVTGFLVFGTDDETALSQFCWSHSDVKGWSKASQSDWSMVTAP